MSSEEWYGRWVTGKESEKSDEGVGEEAKKFRVRVICSRSKFIATPFHTGKEHHFDAYKYVQEI